MGISSGTLATGFSAFAAASNIKYDITKSSGLTSHEVKEAFFSPSVRDEMGAQNIMIFSKSGGNLEDGNKQRNLLVDMPVTITEKVGDISFQYFVDVRDDLTPAMFHCSDIRLHVYLDDKYQYTTEWLGYDDRYPRPLPLQTEILTLNDVKGGKHDVSIKPEGRVGGCNVDGFLFSWGGTIAIFREIPSPRLL